VIMFQMMTASFRAVADIADVLPLRNAIRLKKFESAVSFKLPTALAACLNAIFKRLLPFGIRLLKIVFCINRGLHIVGHFGNVVAGNHLAAFRIRQ